MVRNVPLTFTGVSLTKRKLGGEAEASPLFSLSARGDLIFSEFAPQGRDGDSPPFGRGAVMAEKEFYASILAKVLIEAGMGIVVGGTDSDEII